VLVGIHVVLLICIVSVVGATCTLLILQRRQGVRILVNRAMREPPPVALKAPPTAQTAAKAAVAIPASKEATRGELFDLFRAEMLRVPWRRLDEIRGHYRGLDKLPADIFAALESRPGLHDSQDARERLADAVAAAKVWAKLPQYQKSSAAAARATQRGHKATPESPHALVMSGLASAFETLVEAAASPEPEFARSPVRVANGTPWQQDPLRLEQSRRQLLYGLLEAELGDEGWAALGALIDWAMIGNEVPPNRPDYYQRFHEHRTAVQEALRKARRKQR
jgi:hypothetical protein